MGVKRIKYTTQSERDEIISRKTKEGLLLAEELNLINRNYLVFKIKSKLKSHTEIEELTNYVLDVDFRLTMIEMGLL